MSQQFWCIPTAPSTAEKRGLCCPNLEKLCSSQYLTINWMLVTCLMIPGACIHILCCASHQWTHSKATARCENWNINIKSIVSLLLLVLADWTLCYMLIEEFACIRTEKFEVLWMYLPLTWYFFLHLSNVIVNHHNLKTQSDCMTQPVAWGFT